MLLLLRRWVCSSVESQLISKAYEFWLEGSDTTWFTGCDYCSSKFHLLSLKTPCTLTLGYLKRIHYIPLVLGNLPVVRACCTPSACSFRSACFPSARGVVPGHWSGRRNHRRLPYYSRQCRPLATVCRCVSCSPACSGFAFAVFFDNFSFFLVIISWFLGTP